jgi:hypothetical protein
LKRLTLFAKGNLDLRDTLHALRIGGDVVWNGIGEVVRARRPGWSVRVRHETMTRPDALLAATGAVPAELAEHNLDLGAYPAESQYSTALFEADCDAFVLSIQPSVKMSLWRRRGAGWLFMPEGRHLWADADQAWLREGFDNLGPVEVEPALADLARVVARRRETSDAPILIYNLCAAMPGEHLHIHAGLEDILSTRIRRFNLALVELSQATGISVIDVDAVLSRAGADRLRYDAMHLNADGCRLVAEEVARVLDDLGLFDDEAAA